MKLVIHKDAKVFRQHCRNWLGRNEPLNNGLIGAIDLLAEGSSVYSPPYWFGSIEDNDEILAVALHTKPDGLVTTAIPDDALEAVFESVDTVVGPPHRIMAPEPTSRWLANAWAENDDLRQELDTVWNVYKLDAGEVSGPDVAGELRLCTHLDHDTARDWGTAYGREKPAPVDVSQFMLRKLRRQELYFWDNDGPTTMITLSGFTENGVRISSVYTPQEHRGHGFASAAVASICRLLFKQGLRFVTLVAIDGDPAERVYQRLGFEKIGSRACFNLQTLLHDMK